MIAAAASAAKDASGLRATRATLQRHYTGQCDAVRDRVAYGSHVSRDTEDRNRRLLRARDAMDRAYAGPLDVRAVASIAHVSPAHFSRSFRAVFGETPHRYLQRRRVERSMFLLRETDRSVTDVCFDVGFTSLGTFSRTFHDIVGESPSAYRLGNGPIVAPHCVQLMALRPRIGAGDLEVAGRTAQESRFGEAPESIAAVG
jgi:AraC-like DNA-binding protein